MYALNCTAPKYLTANTNRPEGRKIQQQQGTLIPHFQQCINHPDKNTNKEMLWISTIL